MRIPAVVPASNTRSTSSNRPTDRPTDAACPASPATGDRSVTPSIVCSGSRLSLPLSLTQRHGPNHTQCVGPCRRVLQHELGCNAWRRCRYQRSALAAGKCSPATTAVLLPARSANRTDTDPGQTIGYAVAQPLAATARHGNDSHDELGGSSPIAPTAAPLTTSPPTTHPKHGRHTRTADRSRST